MYALQRFTIEMISDDITNITSSTNSAGKTSPVIEVQPFLAYLQRIIPLATDLNSQTDLEELQRALNENSTTLENVRRFLTDPQ